MPDMVDEYHRAAMSEPVGMPEVMVKTFNIAVARQVCSMALLLLLSYALSDKSDRTNRTENLY